MAKSGRAKKPIPKITLKGEPIQADGIAFSADGRVLLAYNEMLESHAWDVATGRPLVSESIEDAMSDVRLRGRHDEAAAEGDARDGRGRRLLGSVRRPPPGRGRRAGPDG